MGCIKQTYLKRVAEKFLEEYPEEFKGGFDENKVKVGRLTDVTSKSMRNKIAGCITHTLRKKHSEAV
ncbi:MAG TPA: 30S ribosomal protein S17e [Candidatus Altiarchaeales archaeon]|nr:30S ribosomal protein S17e [Candidatus Altiarchaeales archaeon]